ncbi:hypothetical protein [Moorena sp. SIO4G3]|uniref:hypothetical protein n=1 Tax=Moorena sp. SIO4G3 TaxID=2607821 RepID=UPI00142A3111|nr:hypothetical protein [Moorena sp. SIO4G3]NEO77345.1 hypothetical protein [Moorena sp. SIO4G3]
MVNSLFSTIPCSLLPTPYSLLPTPYSLLPTPCSLILKQFYGKLSHNRPIH